MTPSASSCSFALLGQTHLTVRSRLLRRIRWWSAVDIHVPTHLWHTSFHISRTHSPVVHLVRLVGTRPIRSLTTITSTHLWLLPVHGRMVARVHHLRVSMEALL